MQAQFHMPSKGSISTETNLFSCPKWAVRNRSIGFSFIQNWTRWINFSIHSLRICMWMLKKYPWYWHWMRFIFICRLCSTGVHRLYIRCRELCAIGEAFEFQYFRARCQLFWNSSKYWGSRGFFCWPNPNKYNQFMLESFSDTNLEKWHVFTTHCSTCSKLV